MARGKRNTAWKFNASAVAPVAAQQMLAIEAGNTKANTKANMRGTAPRSLLNTP